MEDHAEHAMRESYKALRIEMAVDFAIIYLLMYTMIATLDHFHLNMNIAAFRTPNPVAARVQSLITHAAGPTLGQAKYPSDWLRLASSTTLAANPASAASTGNAPAARE